MLESRGTVDMFGSTALVTSNDYQAVPVSYIKNYNLFQFIIKLIQVDVQWITLSCDPTKPQREGCAELYLVIILNNF